MSQVQRKCQNRSCGSLFMARSADVKRGWAKFCSKRCKAVEQEGRTHQYAALRERSEYDDLEAGMDANEDGWDGHKNAF